MGTLKEFVTWRGDLSFAQDPFHAVDNLIFSTLSYVQFDEILQSEKDCYDLQDLAALYFEKIHPFKEFRDNALSKRAAELLDHLKNSERYAHVMVRNYCSIVNTERTLQFAAMEFVLTDGTSFVAYRGTDDTIVGWKEDFMLAVTEVEAEKEAVQYLNRIAKDRRRLLRVGGHSKGGHLAVYASVSAEEEIKERILQIYTNDGPGFSREFVKSKETKKMAGKVVRILPEESIIGMLMEPVGTTMVVKSSNRGFLQHDLLSWEVVGKKLVEKKTVTKNAKMIDKAVSEWIYSFPAGSEQGFIDDLFAVLEAPGVGSLTELQKNGMKSLPAMTKQLNKLSPETIERVNLILKALIQEMINDT